MRLTFDEILRAREHRILKHLDRYHSLSQGAEFELPAAVVLSEDETVLGVYDNLEDETQAPIFVTTVGLWVFSSEWRQVRYADMDSARVKLGGEKVKTNADTLLIGLTTGETIEVLVTGGDGKLRDVWEVDRFMLRVIGGNKRRQRQE